MSGADLASPPEETGRRAATPDVLRYAAGSLGMGVWVTVPGLLLLYFLTHSLGVSPMLAGLTLLVPKILDAILHPVLGTLSDRAARRTGHRLGMLRFGLLLTLALAAMFSVPADLTGPSAALWVGTWYVVGNVLFACFQVPYISTPSDVQVGYHERTRIFMFRMLLLTVGLLVAGTVAPAMVASGERAAYTRMAVLLSAGMLVTGLVAVAGVRRLTQRNGFRTPDPTDHSVIADIAVAWRDREFRWLVLSYLFTGMTTHLFLAAVPYYTEYVFDRPGLTSVLMGAFLAPAVVAGPMWMSISRRIGKQASLLIAQGLFAVGCVTLLLGSVIGVVATTAVVALLGVGFAGLQLLAFSMVPDAVAAAEVRGGSRAGAYTGVWTASDATSTAIGPYLYAMALSLGGFVSTTSGESVEQSSTAVLGVLLGFTVLPMVLMLVAIAFQRRYRLDVGAR